MNIAHRVVLASVLLVAFTATDVSARGRLLSAEKNQANGESRRRRRLTTSTQVNGNAVADTPVRRLTDAPDIRSAGEWAFGCSAFNPAEMPTCQTPSFAPRMLDSAAPLSDYAHSWSTFMCCSLFKNGISDVISNLWQWKRACTTLLSPPPSDAALIADAEWQPPSPSAMPINDPLQSMVPFCPADLTGDLDLFGISAFIPSLRKHNPHFALETAPACTRNTATTDSVDAARSGSITVALERAHTSRFSSGHINLIIHPETGLEAQLTFPEPNTTDRFLSFVADDGKNTGSMLTGTTAYFSGFGEDLEDILDGDVVTIHGVNIEAAQAELKRLKASGQMFSISMFSCASAVKKLLVKALEHRCTFNDTNHLFPPLPGDYLKFTKDIATQVNPEHAPQVTAAQIRAYQIPEPPPKTIVIVEKEGVSPWWVAVAIGIMTVLALAGHLVYRHVAKQKLAEGMATLLVESLTESKTSTSKTNPMYGDDGQICATSSVYAKFDTDSDGMVTQEEFATVSVSFGLSERQAKVTWNALDKDKSGHLDKDEVQAFLESVPKIRWLLDKM